MEEEIARIGENAGIIWNIIFNMHHGISFNELFIKSGMNNVEFAMAIGWLAREDKIRINFYKKIMYIELYNDFFF